MNTELTPASSGRLASIDFLRGIAVLAVILNHIPHSSHGGWREHPFFFFHYLLDFGFLGVPLFIVISGFCIHRSAALARQQSGEYQLNWAAFWKRRFLRLYPPYVVALVGGLASVAFVGEGYESVRVFLWDMGTHLLMVHNLIEEYSAGAGNPVFWSLGMEEQLYGLYFFLVIALRRQRWWVVLTSVAVVNVAFKILTIGAEPIPLTDHASLGAWFSWPFGSWILWALGALAVDVLLKNASAPAFCSRFSSFALFAVLGLVTDFRTHDWLLQFSFMASGPLATDFTGRGWALVQASSSLWFAPAFFFLVMWALKNEGAAWMSGRLAGVMAVLGRISYSLYLTHFPVIALIKHWVPLDSTKVINWPLHFALHLPPVLLVGACFYRWVERPFLKLYPKGYRRTAPTAA